jgi:hypothetical protein
MLYAAKCYWPGVTPGEVEEITDHAVGTGASTETEDAAYLGSLLFAADDLVLCLFEAQSGAAVKRVSEQLGIPCERVMGSAWIGPSAQAPSPRR